MERAVWDCGETMMVSVWWLYGRSEANYGCEGVVVNISAEYLFGVMKNSALSYDFEREYSWNEIVLGLKNRKKLLES